MSSVLQVCRLSHLCVSAVQDRSLVFSAFSFLPRIVSFASGNTVYRLASRLLISIDLNVDDSACSGDSAAAALLSRLHNLVFDCQLLGSKRCFNS